MQTSYLYIATALIVGLAFGWLIHGLSEQYSARRKERQTPEDLRAERRKQAAELQIDLTRLYTEIQTLAKAIESSKQLMQERDDEYASLVLELDEQQNQADEARAEAEDLKQQLAAHKKEAESLLVRVDGHMEEMDMLNKVHEANQVKINRLSQTIQWQDNELQTLQQNVNQNNRMIDETRRQIEALEQTLERLDRKRQQREQDIRNARADLEERSQVLRDAVIPPAPAPASQAVEVYQLPDGRVFTRKDCAQRLSKTDDDLTRIPGLADAYADQLRRRGIRTFCDLAVLTPVEVAELITAPGHFSPDFEGWIDAARGLARQI